MLSAAELNEHFGRPKTFAPVQVQTRLPWTPRRADGRVQVVLAHPLIAEEFVAACRQAAEVSSWRPQRIDSYVPRAIRGTDTSGGWRLGDEGTSRHSWAVAFDFFATPADVPPPGGVWTPDNGVPPDFGSVFESRGWTWGKRWRRVDVPHIEWSAPPPRVLEDGVVDWLTGLLKQGDTGEAVENLQFMLRAAGIRVWPSGVFDSSTAGAVRAVQEAGTLVVDGIVGPNTEAEINALVMARHGSIAEVVRAAYQDVLGRDPDQEGLPFWVGKLEGGIGVHNLWRQLWTSGEAQARRARSIEAVEAELAEAIKQAGQARSHAHAWRVRAEAAEAAYNELEAVTAGLEGRVGRARALVDQALAALDG